MRKRKRYTPPPAPMSRRSKILGRVAAWYREGFVKTPKAQEWMKAKGATDEALWESSQVGFAAGNLGTTVSPGSELEGDLKYLGVLDKDGHEVLAGCVVFPWFGDNEGECQGLMGFHLETGKEVYLSGQAVGVWNHAAARQSRSVILTDSILKGLLLYQAGWREVIPIWRKDGLTQEHLGLFQRSGVKEVVLTFEAGDKVLSALREEEMAVSVVKLPPLPAPVGELAKLLPRASAVAATEPPYERTVTGFTVRFGERWWEVKGIERGPVKLKVSLCLRMGGKKEPMCLNVIDLYSERNREQYAKRANGQVGAEEETVLEDMGKLIPLVEGFDGKKPEGPKREAMSEAEKAEAMALLTDPKLLERILSDFAACGLEGEEDNKLVGYLAAVSRKLEEPLAVLIQSRSAAGKSTLQEAILRFVPEEDYVKYTRLTGQALFYADETGLMHKLLAIEEEAGARDASYSIRNLQSSKKLTIATTEKDPVSGKMKTVGYEVNGPVALMLTTTAVDMDFETQNRFLTLTIDESKGMTERILAGQREARTLEGLKRKKERERVAKVHQNAQRLLRPLKVVNNLAVGLKFPSHTLRARRDHSKYLNLIEAIAYLHQYQREVKTDKLRTGEAFTYIEVEPADIERANKLGARILGQTLGELSAPGRALLSVIRGMVKDKARKGHAYHFTRREVREAAGWSDFAVKTHLGELEDLEYLYTVTGRKGKEYVYELAEAPEPVLDGLVNVTVPKQAPACPA